METKAIVYFKGALLLILLIPALAVSYYFAIALPSNEHLRLQLERDKYEAEKKENVEREQKRQQNESLLGFCTSNADQDYWTYVKLNGKAVPGKPGAYSAPQFIWDEAEKRKNDALAECHKEFGSK